MTVQTPPYVLQGGSHPAATFRQIQQGQMGSPFGSFAGGIGSTAAGGGHGIVSATDLAVSQNGTPNMSVNVAGGLAFIRGTESASQGVYGGYNDAAVNLAVSASDPTNPRIDLVVLKVRDSFYSGAAADLSLAVVTGTPAASPAAPAVPNNALVLAQVAIAATSTTVLNAAITDKRTRAAALGAAIVCTSTTRPTGASLYQGLGIFETDTNKFWFYTGAVFIEYAGLGPRTAYTPAWTSDGTLPTLGNGTLIGRYRLTGKELDLQITLQTGSTSTYGTSTYRLSIPAGLTSVSVQQQIPAVYSHAGINYPLVAIINGSSSTFVFVQASANAIVTNLVPATMGATDSIVVSGRIEIA